MPPLTATLPPAIPARQSLAAPLTQQAQVQAGASSAEGDLPSVALLPPPAARRHSAAPALADHHKLLDGQPASLLSDAPPARQPAGPDLLKLLGDYQQRISDGQAPDRPTQAEVPLGKNLGGVNLADVHELGRLKAARRAPAAVVVRPVPPLPDTTTDSSTLPLLGLQILSASTGLLAGITGQVVSEVMVNMVSSNLAALVGRAPEVYLLCARLAQRREAQGIEQQAAQSLQALDMVTSAIAEQLLPANERDLVLQHTGAARTAELRARLTEQARGMDRQADGVADGEARGEAHGEAHAAQVGQADGPSVAAQRPIDLALEVLQLMQSLQGGDEVSASYATQRLAELQGDLTFAAIGVGTGALHLGAAVGTGLTSMGWASPLVGTVASGVGVLGTAVAIPVGLMLAIDNARSARAHAVAQKTATALLASTGLEREQANENIKSTSPGAGLQRALARLVERKANAKEKTFLSGFFATSAVNGLLGTVAFGLKFFGLAAAATVLGTVGAVLGVGLAVGFAALVTYKAMARRKAEQRYSTEALERTVAGEQTDLSRTLGSRQASKLYNRMGMAVLQHELAELVKQAHGQAGGLKVEELRANVVDLLRSRLHPAPYSPGELERSRALAQATAERLLPDVFAPLDAQGVQDVQDVQDMQDAPPAPDLAHTLAQLKTNSGQWLAELNRTHALLAPVSEVDKWVAQASEAPRALVKAIVHDFLPATDERINEWFESEPVRPGQGASPESFGRLILEQSSAMGRAAALRKLIRRDTETFLWVCLRQVQAATSRGDTAAVAQIKNDLSAFGLKASTWSQVVTLDEQAPQTAMSHAVGLIKKDLAFAQ